MTTKMALSGMSILSALAIAGGTTFALFTDSATQTGNVFAAGNADLQIAPDVSGNPGTFGDTITGPTFNNLAPGDSRNFDFWLKNSSSSAVPLNLTADVNAINPSDDNTQDIDNALLIKWTCDTTHDNSLADETPTGEFSPRDWLNGGNAGVGSLNANQQMFCRMTGRLPSTADNNVAGEVANFDVVYDATQ